MRSLVMIGMEERYVNIDGYKIRYIEHGDKSKKYVLLIHGLGGSIMSWSSNIPYLADLFHVVAFDLLGFGKSDKPRIDYTMDVFTNIVKGVADALSLDRLSIIGSSLGGQIACEFTLKNMDRVERLVLVSPAGFTPRSFKGTSSLLKYAKIFNAKDIDGLRRILVDVHGSSISDDYLRWMHEYINMENSKHAFLSALRNSAKASRLTRRFKEIVERVNTLVIWGKNDNIIPVKYASFFVNVSNCRLILLEHCSHRPHVEDSRLFNEYVKIFLLG
jgi:2-hydroxy-6-oxonona-2,4-dienedioate hydrolase